VLAAQGYEAYRRADEGIEPDLRLEATELRHRHLFRDGNGRKCQSSRDVTCDLRRRPTLEGPEQKPWPTACRDSGVAQCQARAPFDSVSACRASGDTQGEAASLL
jgi:hypothetical protein